MKIVLAVVGSLMLIAGAMIAFALVSDGIGRREYWAQINPPATIMVAGAILILASVLAQRSSTPPSGPVGPYQPGGYGAPGTPGQQPPAPYAQAPSAQPQTGQHSAQPQTGQQPSLPQHGQFGPGGQ